MLGNIRLQRRHARLHGGCVRGLIAHLADVRQHRHQSVARRLPRLGGLPAHLLFKLAPRRGIPPPRPGFGVKSVHVISPQSETIL